MQLSLPDLNLQGSEVLPMQFTSMKIVDFPPFKDFSLTLPPGVTVIAGTNGVGKSRFLNFLSLNSQRPQFSSEQEGVQFREYNVDGKLVNFDANRSLPKTSVNALRPYNQRYQMEHTGVNTANFSSAGAIFKNWFVHMDYFEARGWIESSQSAKNFDLCKDIFSLLDPSYRFLEVNRDFEVVLETPSGPLAYDQTSSGFQSAYLLLFGIVFGVDFYSQGMESAQTFDGCILIDEIDVHLHPAWQNKILDLIQKIVPQAQIIATTHSPHVIQGLREDQLIVLGRNAAGFPEVRPIFPKPNAYGFQGWTIEEILRDVMGIEETLSPERQQAELAFNEALDDDDLAAAQVPYQQLMSMLHPTNPLRRVYDMQYRAMGGVSL
jgi:hypothetical protein